MFLKKRTHYAFRSVGYVILFALTFFVLIKCEDETMKPRDYPRLNTKPVSDISAEGATFNAELYTQGSSDIIEHGFVWGISDEPTLNNNKILLGPLSATGLFSAKVVSTLANGLEYTVRPFVQTGSQTVYGNPLKFISLGSGAPSISGFEPDSAAWMDTLYIKGERFSWVPEENIVKLNQVVCKSVSSTDTTISVLVGTDIFDLKSILSIELAGHTVVLSKDTLRLISPVITKVYPEPAGWGDTITVKGKHLQNKVGNNIVNATIGQFVSKVVRITKDSIVLIIPDEVNQLTNLMNLKINSLTIPAPKPVSLKPPVINSISPEEGTWGEVMKLKGRFHPNKARNMIEIGGMISEMVTSSRDSISIRVPVNLVNHNNQVVYNSAPFVITARDTFKLFGPRIDSVSPLLGPFGTTCTITGNYLVDINRNVFVKFGSKIAPIYERTRQKIICMVPTILDNGPVEISVLVGNQSTIHTQPFLITNPHISKIYPLTGKFNDTIVIEGEYLPLRPTVLFNSTYAETVSASDSKILVKVPVDVDSIPSVIKIRVSGGVEFFFSEKFVLNPPEITSVPSVLTRGSSFEISGKNFNPYIHGNRVYVGSHLCILNSATPTIISVKVPNIAEGQYRVSVIVGGYRRYYSELCEIK